VFAQHSVMLEGFLREGQDPPLLAAAVASKKRQRNGTPVKKLASEASTKLSA
jgi:hypothetical protein